MWGVNTFDNDVAINWLKKLNLENNFSSIPALIKRYNSLDNLDDVTLDECTEVIAAIEVIATAKTDDFKVFPSEFVDWLTNEDYSFTPEEIKDAKTLFEKIRKDSEIKELYIDSPQLKPWNEYMDVLAKKLQ